MWEAIGSLLQPVLAVTGSLLAPLRTRPKPVKKPEGFTPHADTPAEELDRCLQTLQRNKNAWPKVSCKDRAALLDVMLFRMGQHLKPAAEAAVKAKGSYGSGLGEEMQNFLPAILEMTELRQAMLEGGQPAPLDVYKRPNGQVVAKVFPKGMLGLLFAGWKVEVWMQQGCKAVQGQLYRSKAAGTFNPSRVALVLGAGNQVSVVLADVLYKLFQRDEVVLVKVNPVSDFFGPQLEAVMQPLVELGVLRFVYGGAEVGKYLASHELVDCVHMTGSVHTFNQIVWGAPVPPLSGDPVFPKPVTAELGNVTPYIIVPGPWSESDIEYHADVVVSGLLNNGGFNCAAVQVLVTDKAWPLRDKFLEAVRSGFKKVYRRLPWYPGSSARFEAFKQLFPNAEALGSPACPGDHPTLLAAGLSPEEARVDQENWVPVVQEVALSGTGGDVSSFLPAAVDFANTRCWGTLACSLIIHPATQQHHAAAYDTALQDLRYGAICVNGPATGGYGVPSCTWGGYGAGANSSRAIGSGNCYVHNTSLFDHPDKSVLTIPWRVHPRPLWSVHNTNLEAIVPHVLDTLYTINSPLLTFVKINRTAVSAVLG